MARWPISLYVLRVILASANAKDPEFKGLLLCRPGGADRRTTWPRPPCIARPRGCLLPWRWPRRPGRHGRLALHGDLHHRVHAGLDVGLPGGLVAERRVGHAGGVTGEADALVELFAGRVDGGLLRRGAAAAGRRCGCGSRDGRAAAAGAGGGRSSSGRSSGFFLLSAFLGRRAGSAARRRTCWPCRPRRAPLRSRSTWDYRPGGHAACHAARRSAGTRSRP